MHAQDHGRGRCVEGELVEDHRRDLTCSDAGEQRLAVLRIGVQQQCRGRNRACEQGCGREVVTQLLEHQRRLDERGAEAVVLLGDGQRRHAHLLAEGAPQRLVVPELGVDRPCAPRRCRCACPAASARSTRARPVPRCGRSAFSAPGRGESAIRPRWYADAAPRADERADPVDPEAEVELRGVADRAVHLERHPGGEVAPRRRPRPWPRRRTAIGCRRSSAAPRTSGRAKSRAIRTSARACLIAW